MIPKVNNGNTSKRTKEKKRKTKNNLTSVSAFDILQVKSGERVLAQFKNYVIR